MNEYRITKYNPQYRLNGVYCKDEWTSMSDIGKKFEDSMLQPEEYLDVENRYIQCCMDVMKAAGIKKLSVSNPEIYYNKVVLPKTVCEEGEMREIIKWCLREMCWAKLKSKHFFIHFGYDYYMYIGTELPITTVLNIAQSCSLFCESMHSPYLFQ